MDIAIDERKLSFASEYDISAPDATYYARKAILSFNDSLTLKTTDGNVLAQIEGHFSPLRSKHDFELSDGRTYEFHCEELWKRVFICVGNQETYHLYEHKGLNYSIFKGDQQVAAFTKNRVVLGKGNHYDIRMNADGDLILVLCMVLTINTAEHDDDDSSVTIDFGNIGPEGRAFDETWEPR
jgi:uncharacterized protein YxjI